MKFSRNPQFNISTGDNGHIVLFERKKEAAALDAPGVSHHITASKIKISKLLESVNRKSGGSWEAQHILHNRQYITRYRRSQPKIHEGSSNSAKFDGTIAG